MQVMTLHKFYDEDVEKVMMFHSNSREIVLNEKNEGSLIVNKDDVIALAKEFELFVYDKDASL